MDFASYLAFIGAAILLVMAPGPDSMYVITKSLSSGAHRGITLSWGLAAGPLWHTLLVMVGVAAFIKSSLAAFHLLTWGGALYLLYLSYGAFRSGGASLSIGEDKGREKSFALCRRGFLMNASNPKVLLFFLALLPQFISLSAPLSPEMQITIMGLTFSFFTGAIFPSMPWAQVK